MLAGGCSAGDEAVAAPASTVRSGDITAGRAFVGAHGTDSAAAYVRLSNSGTTDDQLESVSSPDGAVAPMGAMGSDGSAGSDSVDANGSLPVPIPAGGDISFEPGGAHLMLEGMRAVPKPGTTVVLRFAFRTAPPIELRAAVVDVADIPDMMEAK